MTINYISLHDHLDGFVLENLLTPEECEHYINFSEKKGYIDAEINTEFGSQITKSIRNNDRVIVEDSTLAQNIYLRAQDYLPEITYWQPCGFSSHIRFYRYHVGQRFKRHTDGARHGKNGQKSFLTFLIYLNDNFGGGETMFDNLAIQAKQGNALIFLHNQWHEGKEITYGTKYALRFDVMYEKK